MASFVRASIRYKWSKKLTVIKLLHTPYPFIYNYKSILLPGIVTVFLLLSFMPMGLHLVGGMERLFIAGTIGSLASLSIVVIVNVLKWLTTSEALKDHWTIGKELLLVGSVILTISTGIFVLMLVFALSNQPPFPLFQSTVLNTLLLSALPITILVLVEWHFVYKQQLQNIEALNQELVAQLSRQSIRQARTGKKICFQTESTKPVIQLEQEEIVYLKSDGNYVEVHYAGCGGQLKKVLIRNKLKTLIEQLNPDDFFHCHKSYVVNQKWIHAVRGNARNYELSLKQVDIWVPVSRSKANALRAILLK